MLDPRAFTSNRQVGLENKRAKGTSNRNFMSVFPLKSLEPASFGASLVLSTIVLPGKLALISPGTKNQTDAEYHNI